MLTVYAKNSMKCIWGYMRMKQKGKRSIVIRTMRETDAQAIHTAFADQGWDKSLANLESYYRDQRQGKRFVAVAEVDQQIAGYATLLPEDKNGPFAGKPWPNINDLNVFIRFRGLGVASAIMDRLEAEAAKTSDTLTLGVGLHKGYGPAQQLYVRRGYVFDGSGVWYHNKQLEIGAACQNDDDLILYMSKKLS